MCQRQQRPTAPAREQSEQRPTPSRLHPEPVPWTDHPPREPSSGRRFRPVALEEHTRKRRDASGQHLAECPPERHEPPGPAADDTASSRASLPGLFVPPKTVERSYASPFHRKPSDEFHQPDAAHLEGARRPSTCTARKPRPPSVTQVPQASAHWTTIDGRPRLPEAEPQVRREPPHRTPRQCSDPKGLLPRVRRHEPPGPEIRPEHAPTAVLQPPYEPGRYDTEDR